MTSKNNLEIALLQRVDCRLINALPCRYGYSSIWEMQEVVDNYTRANIPLDVMWGDIDYMERWRDFTFDPVNFPLPALQVLAWLQSQLCCKIPALNPSACACISLARKYTHENDLMT